MTFYQKRKGGKYLEKKTFKKRRTNPVNCSRDELSALQEIRLDSPSSGGTSTRVTRILTGQTAEHVGILSSF